MFTSSKRFGPISVAHRQWKSESHCKYIHGYGRIIDITFHCKKRDEKGWVMDFGNLKEIKDWMFNIWDHSLLVAHDDPHRADLWKLDQEGVLKLFIMPEAYGPGIEDSCKYIYDKVTAMIKVETDGRVGIKKVRIYEHEFNWAEYNG